MKMNITPERSFNEHIWTTLKEVKRKSFLVSPKKYIPYTWDYNVLGDKLGDEVDICTKLNDWKVLKMYRPKKFDLESGVVNLHVEIIDPLFSDLYALCENAYKQNLDPKILFKMIQELVQPTDKNSDLNKEMQILIKNPLVHKRDGSTSRSDNLLYTKALKPELTAGDLVAYTDGTIRYKGEILELRAQLKDLCRFFMNNSKRLLTCDDIKEKIIDADKRKTVSFTTLSKYVSALHNSLIIHFKKPVIFNEKKEGWYFDITKS